MTALSASPFLSLSLSFTVHNFYTSVDYNKRHLWPTIQSVWSEPRHVYYPQDLPSVSLGFAVFVLCEPRLKSQKRKVFLVLPPLLLPGLPLPVRLVSGRQHRSGMKTVCMSLSCLLTAVHQAACRLRSHWQPPRSHVWPVYSDWNQFFFNF